MRSSLGGFEKQLPLTSLRALSLGKLNVDTEGQIDINRGIVVRVLMLLSSCLHSALFLEAWASLQSLHAAFTHGGNSSHLALRTKPKYFFIILLNTEKLISSHKIKQVSSELYCSTGRSEVCTQTMRCSGKSMSVRTT